MGQYFINKDDVLSIIKNAIYIEEVYDADTCEEWTYDTIDEKEVIEEINKLPVILIGIDVADKEIRVGDFFKIAEQI